MEIISQYIQELRKDRIDIYSKLAQNIGNTPLGRIENIPIPNNNEIFVKEEYKNPSGSHYDRVFIAVLAELESKERISPNKTHLIETTSGNAGSAFAWLCGELGYEATVIIPDGLPTARYNNIIKYGANLILSKKDLYIKGSAEELKNQLKVVNKDRVRNGEKPYFCPDHSRNRTSVIAMESLAHEVISQMPGGFDYFVVAVGNGVSILGPANLMKDNGLRVVAWDPIQGPTAFEILYPDKYRSIFGIRPGDLGLHHIYGTGVLGVEFPFLREALLGNKNHNPVIDEVRLVIDEDGIARLSYLVSQGKAPDSALKFAKSIPDLSKAHNQISLYEKKPVGYSSAGSMAVAIKICEECTNNSILVIFYDEISRYFNISN